MYNLSKKEKQFFENNGFFGPFKVYEPEQAREMLKAIRFKMVF